MKTKITFYGRRILKTRNSKTGKIEYRKSGQWIGHKWYGSEWGTDRQLKNASLDNKILGISKKIFWGMHGYAGDLIDEKFAKKFKYV